MTLIKFNGFVENYNTNKAAFSKEVEPFVKDSIIGITKRYKSSGPIVPTHSSIENIEFGKKAGDIYNWKTDFDGELNITDKGIAEHLISDSKKSYQGYGISQTFSYQGDTFQVFVNFRKIESG